MVQVILVLFCLNLSSAMATEIKAFTITDIENELVFRYLFDEQTFYKSGIKSQQDTRPTFQEEYRINTNSYVFHPNMLSMELGGSLLFDQSSFETLTDEYSNNEELTGLNARMDFLKQKPYPVTLFYDKQNPSVSVGLGGRFLQENIKYGVDMALLQPVSPVQVSLNAYRQTTSGEGLDQITDDELEHSEIRFFLPYGVGNHAQISYQINNRDSRSGSPDPDLPIEPRTTSTTSTYFDSKNLLGEDNQGQLINVMSYNTQEEFPKREELRINPVVNWQHSSKIASFYRLIYNDSEEETIEITQKSVNGGVGYSGKNYNASMDIQAEDNQSTNLDYQSAGINYLISHDRLTSIGAIKLSYNGGVAYRDQVSDDTSFKIFGEEQELTGTTWVTLNRDFIDVTPVNSIVVSNTGRTQIYLEGLDYEVRVVGSQTQIQRLVDGNIADGQIVLVDYAYETGGTFVLGLSNNNYQIIWDPSRFYEMYIRYRESKQELREGFSRTLNSINSLIYGLRIDRPLLNGINLGGEANFEDHEEDINSYTRLNYKAYIELPLPRLTSLRFSARRQETESEDPTGDVDLSGYIMRLRSRPWLRTQLSFESSYETDTGGIQDRTQKIQRMQLSWSHRQLSLITDAHFSSEEQDDVVRERWAIKFILRRVF